MKGKMMGVALSLSLLGAGSAFAASGPPGVFQRLDTDHDGLISRQEASANRFLTRHFAAIDTNHDGQLSRKEVVTFRRAQAARFRARFAKADANHDGALSRTEAQKMPQLAKNFDRIDVNHDGKVTLHEIQAFRRGQLPGHWEAQ